jgi:large subunit ribosomal protein L10
MLPKLLYDGFEDYRALIHERYFMSSYMKGLLQAEYEGRFAEVGDFLVIETKGVNGNDNNEMRGVLKSKGIKLATVKNAMMQKALARLERTAAVELFERGPCTVAYGGDSVVDVAKAISEWSKKIEVIRVKGAFVDGQAMDSQAADALSKMPNRTELQGTIIMLANSPGAGVTGAFSGPGDIVAGCIKGLIGKLEKEAAYVYQGVFCFWF